MDWNLFWSAFGAIGTTVGSLITAGAVVIAVKQYRQPIEKRIKVEVRIAATIDDSGEYVDFCDISIKNAGIRDVTINSLNIKGRRQSVFINRMQYRSNVTVEFPARIAPEECKEFLFERHLFASEIKRLIEQGVLPQKGNLIVFAIDSLGERYTCKSKSRLEEIIKLA